MKIKNLEVGTLTQALIELAALQTGFKIAQGAARSIRKLEAAQADFNKARNFIIESLCEKDENGKPKIDKTEYVFVDDATKTKCQDEINNLLQQEIEVDLTTVAEKYFENIKEITPSLVYRLEKFIAVE